MKKEQKLWTRDELMLAIQLYCRLPFGRLHSRNPEIIALAEVIGRTANSVAFKLNNFASFDPSLQARGIKGAQNTSKLDRQIWDEFFSNIESAVEESSRILTDLSPEKKIIALDAFDEHGKSGEEVERTIKVRVNQNFFRQMILASYNYKCCITGIEIPELLVAGHIVPWKSDQANRLNPHNGICINALHDRAFEAGLLTITPDYLIQVSNKLKTSKTGSSDFFAKYHGKPMHEPSRFLPDAVFLKAHNQRFIP